MMFGASLYMLYGPMRVQPDRVHQIACWMISRPVRKDEIGEVKRISRNNTLCLCHRENAADFLS